MPDLKNINKTNLVKNVTGFVVGCSTTAITHAIVRNNVSEPENALQKGMLVTSSTVFGWMVSEKTRAWTDAKIDKLIADYHEAKAKNDKNEDEAAETAQK